MDFLNSFMRLLKSKVKTYFVKELDKKEDFNIVELTQIQWDISVSTNRSPGHNPQMQLITFIIYQYKTG